MPKGLTYAVGPKSLQIVGSPTEPTKTTKTVVFRATSRANGLYVDYPITIEIGDREPATFDLSANPTVMLYKDEATNMLKAMDSFDPNPYLNGSRINPLNWSVKNAPDWLKSIPTSGRLLIASAIPTLGTGSATMNVKDSDDPKIDLSSDFKYKVTLFGNVASTETGNGKKGDVVRVGEGFKTPGLQFTNVVWPLNTPVVSPDTFNQYLNPDNHFEGRFSTSGTMNWSLNVIDKDSRSLAAPINYSYTVIKPLELKGPVAVSTDAKQYDAAHPILINLRPATNAIGKIFYTVSGLPGRVYYKYLDDNNVMTWVYIDGNSVGHTITLPANKTEAEIEYGFPNDHIILNEDTLELKGISSVAGTFNVTLYAHDKHDTDGYKAIEGDSGPGHANEYATSPTFTVLVAPADALALSSNMTAETVHEYTSQPTMNVSVSNAAYGKSVYWNKTSGTLPAGVTASSYDALTFTGYPTEKGTFSGLVFEATDAAGRTISTDPLSLTVTDRENLDFQTSNPNPRTMIVEQTDADQTISAIHTPFGQTIPQSNWVVTGEENLPPGVTYTIHDGGVYFAGVPTKLGTYSGITVQATDSLNQVKSLALTFNSIESPDEIG